MAQASTAYAVNFQLQGDEFTHAWFFNRFRIDKLGKSFLITVGLATDAGGILAVNAFVLGEADHRNNRVRSLDYLSKFGERGGSKQFTLSFSSPPERVYPVNHLNLSRVDEQAEMGLYRFSIKSLAEYMVGAKKPTSQKPASILCYPVVMFRSDLDVQLALVTELYAFEDT